MPKINGERLLDDLKHLRSFGKTGSGVVRLSLSDIDMQSRHWLCDRFSEAGLDATIDGAGTVLAHSGLDGPGLLIGSHTDTQPAGGWLDGAMGVIYGLEVARAIREDPATRHLSVSVASWIDEESTFYGCLGSKSFCGHVDVDAVSDTKNAAGESLGAARDRHQLTGRPVHNYRDHPYVAYLEAHIEQGPSLEANDLHIGVVTDIVGSRNVTVTFGGKQNHAGTTPMPLRRDALQALFRFASSVNARFESLASDRTVWTIGRIDVEPNAPSIIPGMASMALQFRDPSEAILDQLQAVAQELAAQIAGNGITVRFEPRRDHAIGVPMDTTLQEHLARAAATHAPGKWTRMPSGAVHDAQVLASRMPAGMLFIPSIGGVSHAFDEDSHENDIVLGCQVLADASASYLTALE